MNPENFLKIGLRMAIKSGDLDVKIAKNSSMIQIAKRQNMKYHSDKKLLDTELKNMFKEQQSEIRKLKGGKE